MRWALHFAIRDDATVEDIESRLSRLTADRPEAKLNPVVFCDGDSFIEWGEPYDPSLGFDLPDRVDAYHAVIAYSADTPRLAWIEGVALWRALVRMPESVVRVDVTCDPKMLYSPLAITAMEQWSSQVAADGSIVGDPLPERVTLEDLRRLEQRTWGIPDGGEHDSDELEALRDLRDALGTYLDDQ